MTALFLCFNKKWSWLCLVFAFLMGLSRIYLTVHYASDVLGGLLVGAIGGTLGYLCISLLYNKVIHRKDNAFLRFFKNADLIVFIKEKIKKG
jgi:undecaprenyl-diphosphatase